MSPAFGSCVNCLSALIAKTDVPYQLEDLMANTKALLTSADILSRRSRGSQPRNEHSAFASSQLARALGMERVSLYI